MRGDDFCDLLLGESRSEHGRGGQVLRTAVPFRHRVVGNLADQILEEAVLAPFRRARIRLRSEQLLAHETGQERSQIRLRDPGEPRERSGRERLAEHSCVLHDAALVGG